MMVQEMLNLMPPLGNAGLTIALIGTLVGVVIWLTGSRYSRPVVTLLTVAIGTLLGLHVPRWLGWNINSAGPAVGAALIFGVTGYVLHGFWVGIGLGSLLSGWAALGCWIALRHGTVWTWPAWTRGETLIDFTQSIWHSLPPNVAHLLPVVALAGMIIGLASAIIWPKAALLLGWSLAGTTLVVCMGIAAVQMRQPHWLAKIPPQLWAQIGLLGLLVSVGTAVQWGLSPKPATAKPAPKRRPTRNDADDDED